MEWPEEVVKGEREEGKFGDFEWWKEWAEHQNGTE
jgi:hypothetical protein